MKPDRFCTCWPGATVWLTGLPSAGKTTIAQQLATLLQEEHRRVEILDGDQMRTTLSQDLGFSRADREANVERVSLVAEVLARNDILVLVPVIAPYAAGRQAARERHEHSGTPFLEVHVATPAEVCAQRDVKGLYARRATGEITNLTGVDAPYEPPPKPDLMIQTHRQTAAESAAELHTLLSEKGLA